MKRLLLLLIMFLPLVNALNIDFVSPTPSEGSTINIFNTNFSVNISQSYNNTNITYYDGANNYSLFDEKLIVFYNFDNRSSLGENDTYISDLSQYSYFNLTVFAVENSPGKYGRAYYSNGTGTAQTFISPLINKSTEQSYCFWIKAENEFADSYGYIFQTRDAGIRQDEFSCYISNSTSMAENGRIRCELWNNTANTVEKYLVSGPINDSSWHHFCAVVEETRLSVYTDGKITVTGTFPLGAANLTNRTGRFLFSKDFNGSLDDFLIFNKKLTASEVSKLYKTSLTKMSNTEWNVSLINEKFSVGLRNIILCSKNNSFSYNCTIRQLYINSIANVINRNQIISVINDMFYGTNIQNPYTLVSNRRNKSIDTDHNGVVETVQNYTWQRETFENSGLSYIRIDASLGSWYYALLWNKDFEQWGSQYYTPFNLSSSTRMSNVRGDWYMSVNQRANVTVGRSTDALTGTYSLNATSTSQTGTNYIIKDIELQNGNNYTLSYYAKGNGSFVTRFREGSGDYTACGASNSFTANSTWQRVNITCTANSTYATSGDYEIVLVDGIGANETILLDNMSITMNGVETSWYRKFTSLIDTPVDYYELLKYLKQHNKKMLLIMDYMPDFLAEYNASNCVVANTNDTDTADCLPYNFADWRNITLDFVDWITNNGEYQNMDIEVWNEPYGGFFMDQLSYDNITIANNYVILYNNTRDHIKNKYPQISIGGPSGYNLSHTPNCFTQFFAQVGNRTDFISYHPYSSVTNNEELGRINEITRDLYVNCTGYGANCSRLVASEWHTSYSERNQSFSQSSRYNVTIARTYIDWLNSFADKVQSMPYHWDDPYSYFNNPTTYSEYPSFWSSVSHAGLDNLVPTYYPMYTITQKFATYHPSGATVINSTSDYNMVKVVATKLNSARMVTVINTDTDSVNVTLNLGENVTTLYRSDNGQILTTHDDGLFYLGVIESYEVVSFYGSVAYPYRTEVLCEDTLEGLGSFAELLPLLIVATIGGILVVFLLRTDDSDISIETTGIAIVSMIIAVAIGAQIISRTTGC